MIRYPFIYNQVLQIYRDMEQIRFPIEPDNTISRFSNCRIRTYQQFAQTNGCSIRDVICYVKANRDVPTMMWRTIDI